MGILPMLTQLCHWLSGFFREEEPTDYRMAGEEGTYYVEEKVKGEWRPERPLDPKTRIPKWHVPAPIWAMQRVKQLKTRHERK